MAYANNPLVKWFGVWQVKRDRIRDYILNPPKDFDPNDYQIVACGAIEIDEDTVKGRADKMESIWRMIDETLAFGTVDDLREVIAEVGGFLSDGVRSMMVHDVIEIGSLKGRVEPVGFELLNEPEID